jgi:meiotically up-regulated gene 157 (Mug157) protein
MAVVALSGVARVLDRVAERRLANDCRALAYSINEGIKKHGFYDHPKYGKIFRYETDGFEGQKIMDDPNVPSLLSLPYLGYVYKEHPVYQATRKMIFSKDDPYYAEGKHSGLASPHTGLGRPWHISEIIAAETTDNDEEIKARLKTIIETDAGTGFMKESFNVNDPTDYTRPWFAWPNSLLGGLVVRLATEKPWILEGEI